MSEHGKTRDAQARCIAGARVILKRIKMIHVMHR
jgi:hypothetical protein